jgi:hypothetical protein
MGKPGGSDKGKAGRKIVDGGFESEILTLNVI